MKLGKTEVRHSEAPVVTGMLVIPVAGHDSMLLNLSGAHGPYFTRNVVILKDNSGHTGVGEVPGGEKIRQTLEILSRSSSASQSARTIPSSTRCARNSPIATRADAAFRRTICGLRFMRSLPLKARCSICSDNFSA